MAGTAQGDRTGRNAGGGLAGSLHHLRGWPIRVIQSVASSIGLDVRPVNLRDAGEIERAVTAFARSANGGLVVTASALSLVHSELILALAARHKLPAIYPRRSFVAAGGSMGLTLWIRSSVRPATSIVFSKARSLPICQYRRRRNTSW
jgi:hypothetical protein